MLSFTKKEPPVWINNRIAKNIA